MLNSIYESVFGPTQPPIPDPSTINPPSNPTTNAAQNALNGVSNSSSPSPIAGNRLVSWIQGAWETVKGGVSLIYSILTHPLVKIVLSVIILAACTIGFFVLASNPLTFTPTMFGVYAFGLVFGITAAVFIASSTILGGGAPPPGEDDVDAPTNSNKPNNPNKPVEESKPTTYMEAMARLRKKEKENEELKKAAKTKPVEEPYDVYDDFI